MRPAKTNSDIHGLLLVDKPAGWTSNDVVQKTRGILQTRKIGHAGTLDPAAEGLLVLLIGRATKQQTDLQGKDKDYEARVRLGARTDTADAEGEVVERMPVPDLTLNQISAAAEALVGPHDQVPPAYSAVKVNGKPAYFWARKQQAVSLKARRIQVHRWTIQDHGPDWVRFQLSCSSGTYVRVLAEQLAEKLGTVGHLDYLRRTRIADWEVSEAVSMDWMKTADPSDVRQRIVPLITGAPEGVSNVE